MGKALQKSRKQGKRKPRATSFPPNSGVSGGFRAGKRKRGNSLLKVLPRETAATNTVADDIRQVLALDPQAQAHMNASGTVKLLTYQR